MIGLNCPRKKISCSLSNPEKTLIIERQDIAVILLLSMQRLVGGGEKVQPTYFDYLQPDLTTTSKPDTMTNPLKSIL